MPDLSYTTPAVANNSSFSETIQMPSGSHTSRVKVNTGNVNWNQVGNNLTMNFSGGAWAYRTSYSYTYDCTASPSSTVENGSESGTRQNYQYWNGSSWVYDYSGGDAPVSQYYNDGNYSGNLSRTSLSYGTVAYHYDTEPTNPANGTVWNNSSTPWYATYSGSCNAIYKTCTGTGYTYYYQYIADILYDNGRFSRFYNVTHYGRGKRGPWST